DNSMEIIGGDEVPKHSRPYMALLEGNTKGICGGALIAPKWVVTAAHCKNIIKVKLGVHSRLENEKEIQIKKVKKSVPHPCYDTVNHYNDIMLLKLDKQVKKTSVVSFLPLPNSGKDVPGGVNCTVAGWGKTTNTANKGSDVLRAVNITVIDRKKCNSAGYYNLNPIIANNMLCAGWVGKKEKDTCQGDSGGPLICNGEFRAISSFGRRCGIQRYPGVYTLLDQHNIMWIHKIMKSED
ncbi:GRAA protein, partial [Amia calva]|nr:GRAA protein [Amia calva]